MMPRLYLETTVPSYLVARLSRDILVAAHQQVTQEWWDRRRSEFDIVVSVAVLDELAAGDPDLATARLAAVAGFVVLSGGPAVDELVRTYVREIGFPPRAFGDAAHLAFATHHAADYLLTWNCAHLANGEFRRRFERLNAKLGLQSPTICTPEEMMGE